MFTSNYFPFRSLAAVSKTIPKCLCEVESYNFVIAHLHRCNHLIWIHPTTSIVARGISLKSSEAHIKPMETLVALWAKLTAQLTLCAAQSYFLEQQTEHTMLSNHPRSAALKWSNTWPRPSSCSCC